MITYPYENLFKEDSIDKQLHIVGESINLGNVDIYQEAFELEENLNGDSERDIQYGDCVSHILRFTTTYLEEMKGKDITVSVDLDNHTEAPFTFGTFTIYEDKLTADRTKKEVVAYDALYKINNADVIEWYNEVFPDLETTITVKDFRDSFFEQFGVTQETITLDNDDVELKKTVNAQELSGALILRSICAMNGCFGKINRQGNFEYFYVHQTSNPLYPALTLYPSEDLFPAFDGDYDATEVGERGTYIRCEYENFDVMPIDKLIIRDEEGEVGVSYGDGTNAYIMQNNILLFGMSTAELTEIAEKVYNRIAGAYYRPCEIECKGNPCLEVGDGIYVKPTNGRRFVTIISKRIYKGIQAQRDTFTTEGTQYRDQEVNSYDSQIYALRGKSNKLTRDLEHTISELADFEQNVETEFEQTASDISAKVSKTDHNAQNTFGWTLDTTGFDVKANSVSVFKVNSTGAEVQGKITATSGYIGTSSQGFVIDSDDIHNGMTSLNDTSHDGVYIGTDGLACGKSKFKVDNSGNVKATSGNIGAWNFDSQGLKYSHSQGASAQILPTQSGSLGGIEITSQEIDIKASRNIEISGENSIWIESLEDIYFLHGTSGGTFMFGIGDGNSHCYGSFRIDSTCYASNYQTTSDRRLKEDIKELNSEKSKKLIMALKPCEFTYKTNGEKHHGFIAQEVEELIDDDWGIVSEYEDEEESFKSISYTDIIADLVATVQNQQKQIDELKSIINKREGDLK
ncbi:MAG: tail fiber domain-containing protein [Methanobrevibacter sp.]|nr:tail fiber domain-containing protein [Methanobrevibacter sp.]